MVINSVSVYNSLLPGDFDGDNDVDGADFVVWQTHFPTASGASLATGDADGDGDVDGADFVTWQSHFPMSASAAVVPEPHSFWILICALLPWMLRRRHAKSFARQG
ncbi:MAG: hypothetical protein IT427_20755 [Pirellulales bacterium]|nr:hypothetical protein [Pirellulales bacterium]